ncbi:hypothetical protein L6260_01625 [Candidatus Parcubacteria bacterium]|nr:hypothetical protein [Candidatus Parcubacteria bacterium]
MYTKGFTKIEVLIIAAIIGILGITAVIAVSTARSRTRDAVRMSDVRQMQAGLELYFINHNEYPQSAEYIPLGMAGTSCLAEQGFLAVCNDNTYLESIGATPATGLDGLSSCGDISNAYCYVAEDGDYRIGFELEYDNPIINLQKGLNCATQSGLEPGACDLPVTISQ